MSAGGPSTTSTVSASGVDAITAKIDVEPLRQAGEDLEQIYDIDATVARLIEGSWSRASWSVVPLDVLHLLKICLQFPDELLHDSVPVFQAIRSKLPAETELYVLADTTYGSCCVDEVAAQHVDGQIIVHYGHTCLSPPARLSVLYVFPKLAIDAVSCSRSLLACLDDNLDAVQERKTLLLLTDVAYYWRKDEIAVELERALGSRFALVRSHIDAAVYLYAPKIQPLRTLAESKAGEKTGCCQGGMAGNECCGDPLGDGCACKGQDARQVPPPPPSEVLGATQRSACRTFKLPEGQTVSADAVILYVGPESLALNNLLLTNPKAPVISYDPNSAASKLESSRTNRMLMRRYGVISRARDADVFGIVVGTLGISSYLPTLQYLRKLLKRHKKKSYTMAVGKLTPAKLGNFLEVECWVLVACGENSLVEGHKDFLRPIVTPWELEVALGERVWISATDESKGYTLDFARVLAQSASKEGEDSPRVHRDEDAGSSEEDPEGPTFSTVTGTYRYRRTYGGESSPHNVDDLEQQASALAIRSKESAMATVLSSAGGQHLATRSWKGLDPRYGQDSPSLVQTGRSGIASKYGHDLEASARSDQHGS